jgi:hypothetical protein
VFCILFFVRSKAACNLGIFLVITRSAKSTGDGKNMRFSFLNLELRFG